MNTHSSKPWLIPVAAITGLLLVILYALGAIGGPEQTEPGSKPAASATLPAGAKTFTLHSRLADNSQAWPGTLRSRTVAKLAPKLNARIVEIRVHAGSRVKKGDVIARLDNREQTAAVGQASAALNAAQAQAAQASADEKRMSDLYQKQAATRQSYDAAVAQAKAARAMVSQAASAVAQVQVNQGENVIYAPFDGIISERFKEPGDMGLANEPIVSLQKPDDLRLEADIPASCAVRVKLGDTVAVRIDNHSQALDGRIDEIVPEIDPVTRSQRLKVSLSDTAGLQHGQFGWLQQPCSDQQAGLWIPLAAVHHYGQLEAVKIVDKQQVYSRHIRSGRIQNEQVEVLSGLREGETVLLNQP